MKIKLNRSFLPPQITERYLVALMPALQQKKVQSFTTIVLTLITISFFGFFAINPTFSTIADLRKQIDDSQFVHERLQIKISNLAALQDEYGKIKNDLASAYAAIPTLPDIPTFLGQVQSLGSIDGIAIDRVQTLPVDLVTSGSKYTSYSFTIDGSGSYANLSRFLGDITNISRLVTIDTITLHEGAKLGDPYRINIRGKAFFKS